MPALLLEAQSGQEGRGSSQRISVKKEKELGWCQAVEVARCQGMVVDITVAEVMASRRKEQPRAMELEQREDAREEVQPGGGRREQKAAILQGVEKREEVSARGRRKRPRRSCVVCGGEGVLEVEGMTFCETCLSAQ